MQDLNHQRKTSERKGVDAEVDGHGVKRDIRCGGRCVGEAWTRDGSLGLQVHKKYLGV